MIGVNSQIESPNTSSSGQAGNVGIGFAIPANTVKNVVAQLKATGKASHAYLGVSTADASGAGAQVAQVTASGPAANGGLEPGDVITSLGGKAVDDSSALTALVDSHKAGDSVQVEVTRNGSKKTADRQARRAPGHDRHATEQQQQPQEIPGFGGGW